MTDAEKALVDAVLMNPCYGDDRVAMARQAVMCERADPGVITLGKELFFTSLRASERWNKLKKKHPWLRERAEGNGDLFEAWWAEWESEKERDQ